MGCWSRGTRPNRRLHPPGLHVTADCQRGFGAAPVARPSFDLILDMQPLLDGAVLLVQELGDSKPAVSSAGEEFWYEDYELTLRQRIVE